MDLLHSAVCGRANHAVARCINQIRALLYIWRSFRVRPWFRQVITALDPTNAVPNHLELEDYSFIHPFSFSKVAHVMIDD